MSIRFTLFFTFLLLLLGGTAQAQQAEVDVNIAEAEADAEEAAETCACPEEVAEEVVEEDPPPPRWEGNVQFGYTETSGNTEEQSTKAAAEVFFREGNWRNVFRGDYLYSESDGDETADRYFVNNRTGYTFTEKDYVWLSLSYEDDEFNGFDYTASAAVGYGRQLIGTDTMTWLFEIGPGYRFSETDDGEEEDEEILRLNSEYRWNITETSTFEQLLSSEIGSDNTITRSVTSLTLNVIEAINVRVSYEVNHTDEVPEDKDDTDTITSVTLLYSF